jgi:peptide/nickel transport system ATP-binding protein
MIFISHDLSLAAELADRVLTMYAGRIVEEARVDDLFYRPRHPYTVGLLRAVPRVSGELGTLTSIPGSPPDLVRPPSGCAYHPRCPLAIPRCREEDPSLVRVDSPAHTAACIRWEAVAETVGVRQPAEALR